MSTLETEAPVAIDVLVDHSRRKLRCLIVFVVWSFVYGLLNGVVPMGHGRLFILFLANGAVCTISLAKWTLLDVEERAFPMGHRFRKMLMIFPGPTVMGPIYFFQSRERFEAFWLCVQAGIFYGVFQGAIVGAMFLLGKQLLAS